ncbi:MAG: alanine--tRNA ligase [Alphaproteobacteria bacterium]|nr:alanine--tRNA ligase [Alphaproteobacteria bacterium]
MPNSNDIRRAFLDYFRRNGHEVVASSPLVPRNDPTLLFTNAGMVQFKNVFTGAEARPYARAATAQKCVRAGGKHNDLENVGYTARHLTFFEMLGNFSFGDYFKDRAIELAWNLVTKDYGLAKDRLTVTVYAEDEEAARLWKKIAGLPDSRIIRIATNDNFWSMGDTGPCGPCSEIFYDHGAHIAGGPPGSPDGDGDRFVEVWNLVFMQYEQQADGRRLPLPKPSIDTGLGLERIAAVLQGKHDIFDTDVLRALIEASARATGSPADGPHAVSHRAIADHARSGAFLIADGVLPSNEGRGYVLRRILRRAMRHAHMTGARDLVLHQLVPILVRDMGAAFPELTRAEALVTETFRLEEERFKDMLGRGLKLLEEEAGRLPKGGVLKGELAFKLYDTFGFPLDLTADILRGRGQSVDAKGFETAMAGQRAAARKAWSGSGEAATERVWFEIRARVGATEFLGYDAIVAEGQVKALLSGGQEVQEAAPGTEVAVIFNQTPFYGESGGQMGDTGALFTAGGTEIAVSDTHKKLGDLIVHFGRVTRGTLKLGDVAELRVDAERRAQLRASHSATHLLHAALRRRLGAHVTQKGSLVAPDRLRFDFSHTKPLSGDDLAAVEVAVNAQLRKNRPARTRLMTPEQAIGAGAMALFGEKYGDEVRVVSMGVDSEAGGDAEYSTELCGGTHVSATGEIGLFKVVGESALAAGVRRIEGLTGEAARAYLNARDRLAQDIGQLFKSAPEDAPARVAALIEERKRLERELAEARKKLALGGGASSGPAASPAAVEINGIRYSSRRLEGIPAKELRGIVDQLKREVGSGVVAVAAIEDGKASLVVGVTEDLTKRISAVDLLRLGVAELGGKGGGGRPDLAQGGGPDVAKAQSALDAIGKALAS